jgi:large subunit ribosomal protein L24
MQLRKGDLVAILKGKERGKKGKILRLLTDENRVVVEGMNYVKVYVRPSQQNPKGGIAQMEGKIHRSNVQLICSRCSKPTRGGYQSLADGTKHRICKKCNEII